MILIFGGTTEGRVAAEVCDNAAKEYLYSTRSDEQQLLATTYARRVIGGMDVEQMKETIEKFNIKLLIDAAHPYAKILHLNIAQAAATCNIPVVRLERRECDVCYHGAKYFDTLTQVVDYLENENMCDILALTGVKSATQLSRIATKQRVTLRMMDRELSHETALKSGFPESNIVYYDLKSSTAKQNNLELCKSLNIRSIVTKESGSNGGFEDKMELARQLKLPLLIIKRPALPPFTMTVFGEFGLRRAIEKLLPEFFALHTGFTTGSAATAASVAAVSALIGNPQKELVEIFLPNGEPIKIAIQQPIVTSKYAECTVIKDGGDDPDATDKIAIIARVQITDSYPPQINIRGGKGVGVVTLSGIGIDVGESAINPVPRKMIEENITRIAHEILSHNSIDIEIEVPKGEDIGAKTFNPRLGIVGGISILGTSGIVQPFSSEAFLESIQRQIHIVKAIGHNKIVINSGAMSERYVKAHTPELPQQCYIHYGNLVGATIELASREGVKSLTIGCMVGKAVKLAKGALDTHSKSTIIDRDFIMELASEAKCSVETITQIAEITTARQLWSVVPRSEYTLFDLIASRCFDQCKPLFTNGELELLLISESGKIEAIVKG